MCSSAAAILSPPTNHATHVAVRIVARDHSSALGITMMRTAFRDEPLPLRTEGSPRRP